VAFHDDLVAGKRPKLVIQAPPQHGKSFLVIDFISWLAGKQPGLRTIYASFSERLGIRANLRLQRTFTSDVYGEIFPGTRINPSKAETPLGQFQRNREILEYVGHEGYFRNTTVRGPITGETLDLGVIDDPIKGRAEANSEAVRNATWDWFTDDFLTRFSEDAGLLTILTRWHVDDLIGRLLDADSTVKVLSYPAIAEHDEPHRKQGEALFPEHKSLAFLQERRALMPQSHWLALYQQRPVVEEGNLFRPESMPAIDAIPAGAIKWVRGWDLAASTDGDYTAGALMGKLPDGRYVIADLVRIRSGPDVRDAAILNTAARDGHPVRISLPQDPGQAGKTQALYLTRKLAGYRVVTSPESGDKVTRALPLAAQINTGNVLLLRGAWNAPLLDEMRLFPNGAHDDQIDALSRAFADLIAGRTSFFG